MNLTRRQIFPLAAGAAATVALTPSMASATTSAERAFIRRIVVSARAERAKYRVPVSVSMGQAIMESGWGTSEICRGANNFHGIKALRSNGHSHGKKWFWTTDWTPEKGFYRDLQPFHVFKTEKGAFLGHGNFLQHPNYAPAFKHTGDPYRFLLAVDKGGYGGDGTYAEKVWAVIKKHRLTDYDS
ncbi:glucosaminidase domain-containing protein [Kytococcus sedentarius]|uniref:glucosaminidase domain-containing protein n=1 Tax=Kytococcus sedentarius TaxID=1276 RepID=UPI0035BC327A